MPRQEVIDIKLNIDNIMKLKCLRMDCRHNLVSRNQLACNLKHMTIDENGQCTQFTKREKNESR